MSGPIAFVGGREWGEGCAFDRDLLAASGGDEVVVLPTAAAYEHPQRAVDRATSWFATLGAKVRALMVLSHADALDPANAAVVREARFVYLGGGSPLHLRSVLKDTPVWSALVEASEQGAVIAGSSAGAMVLGEPMVDPRGGAFTLGLALIRQLAVITDVSTWSPERLRRTISLAADKVPLAVIDEQTALVRDPSGTWTSAGVGGVEVHVGGIVAGLADLP